MTCTQAHVLNVHLLLFVCVFGAVACAPFAVKLIIVLGNVCISCSTQSPTAHIFIDLQACTCTKCAFYTVRSRHWRSNMCTYCRIKQLKQFLRYDRFSCKYHHTNERNSVLSQFRKCEFRRERSYIVWWYTFNIVQFALILVRTKSQINYISKCVKSNQIG